MLQARPRAAVRSLGPPRCVDAPPLGPGGVARSSSIALTPPGPSWHRPCTAHGPGGVAIFNSIALTPPGLFRHAVGHLQIGPAAPGRAVARGRHGQTKTTCNQLLCSLCSALCSLLSARCCSLLSALISYPLPHLSALARGRHGQTQTTCHQLPLPSRVLATAVCLPPPCACHRRVLVTAVCLSPPFLRPASLNNSP